METHDEMIAREMSALKSGKVPEDGTVLKKITVGMSSLTDFLTRQYLDFFIPAGGSKIKLVTGNAGSGKTHLVRYLSQEADIKGFLTVSFSAKKIWLNDFREIYLEVLRQCDIQLVLEGCASQVVRNMGHDLEEIPAGKTFMDLLSERGEGDALSKNEIRAQLRTFFTRNPLLDHTFATCCSLLTGGILGHPMLEKASRDVVLAFLHGDKSVRKSQLKALGLVAEPVTKMNARHLLRSLCEVVHLAGYAGVFIVIDDLEALLNRNPQDPMRYTKLRREDAYESIRQMIDDIDSMRYVLFALCFDRELMDDESLGLKSYQALWMRVQSEVISRRFNRFADIIDMDRYADEMYTAKVLQEMSRKLVEALMLDEDRILSAEKAEELRERAAFGRLGLPYMVNRATVDGGVANG